MHRVQPKIFEISVAARAVRGVLQLLRGVSEDGSGPARLDVRVDERIALDAVVPLPFDGEVGVGLFDVDGLGSPVPVVRQARRLYRAARHLRSRSRTG